jgi:hypothetical protein
MIELPKKDMDDLLDDLGEHVVKITKKKKVHKALMKDAKELAKHLRWFLEMTIEWRHSDERWINAKKDLEKFYLSYSIKMSNEEQLSMLDFMQNDGG